MRRKVEQRMILILLIGEETSNSTASFYLLHKYIISEQKVRNRRCISGENEVIMFE